jgi:hypothetical protein
VQRDADLLQVVFTRRPAGCFPGLLHRRQQLGDQDGDNRDHHQQLNQRETTRSGTSLVRHGVVRMNKKTIEQGISNSE